MAQSVLTRPKVAISNDRSAADCSRLGNFHTHAGLLDMVLCEPCVAGTKGVINRKTFTRSSQVVFPAFIGVKEYYDFFKVPIRYLWNKWNDWKLNINDLNSARDALITVSSGVATVDTSLPQFCPRMDFKGLYDTLYCINASSRDASHVNEANNFLRLMEQCGYKQRATGDTQGNTLNLFKAAAYQKVYYDHYRNTTYESINQFAYNFDWLYQGGVGGTNYQGLLDPVNYVAQAEVAKMLFHMHYVNWQNDYFHNIYPALTYVSSDPNGMSWSLPSSVMFNNGSSTLGSQFVVASSLGGGQTVGRLNAGSSASSFTVQQVRAAFALDKLMRASAYAPKHVKDQLKARFGVDVGDKVSFESERLGGFVSDVSFGEVTQTVDTSAVGSPTNLGAVGGKGVGAADFEKDIDFYCEEDSLIVGIHYFIPTAMYDSVQDIWSQNLQREEFFQPEFQNLGLRPIVTKNIQGSSILGSSVNTVLGYTVPNEIYKIGKNQNYFMFNDIFGMIEYDSLAGAYQFNNIYASPLSDFTTHVNENGGSVITSLTADYFKVKPKSLDWIMASSYNGTPKTDQFFGCYRIKFAKVHPMDVHGQPSL